LAPVLKRLLRRVAAVVGVLPTLLRRVPRVVVVLIALAVGAYAINALLLSDDGNVAAKKPDPAASLRVSVMAPGSFESAHPFAPYYVVPRARFRDPSELSRVARNKIVTNPESALPKGGIAGSPQIVRLSLRSTAKDPLTISKVSFRVVSDARPVRGWFTVLSGCAAAPVRRAQGVLDSKRSAVRYVSRNGVVSRNLALEVSRAAPQVIELRAATKKRRVAWTAELSVSDGDGTTSMLSVDDRGKPFRVTSASASRGYEPVYGPTGITGFSRSKTLARAGSSC
jgi:hypothetical protein